MEQLVASLKELSCLKYGVDKKKTKLKPVHVLRNIYFQMSPYDLDELCEWVRNKISFFFNKDGLLKYGKQCSSISFEVF